MIRTFRFEHNGQLFNASGEAFFADGMLKYRVAFQSSLIIIREIASSVGSSTGTDFIQDVEVNEHALPYDLVQSIGISLEDIDFFPGSFLVEFTHNDVEYSVQLVKKESSYQIVYIIPAGLENMPLPVIVYKEKKGKKIIWTHHHSFPWPWFDNLVRAIEHYEKGKE